jgi:hypothetical protein
MHIFSIFCRMYHIDGQFIVYASFQSLIFFSKILTSSIYLSIDRWIDDRLMISSIYHKSIIYLSFIYHLSIIYLSSIFHKSIIYLSIYLFIYQSIINLSSTYHLPIIYLSIIYHLFIIYLSIINLSSIY